MKNTQFDIRVVAVSGFLGFVAVFGWLLPSVFDFSDLKPSVPVSLLQFFETVISVLLALLVWCSFLLVRPARNRRKWAIAEWIVVPLVWLLLLALDAWVLYLWRPLPPPDVL